jgi:hypothetical protein
MKSIMDVSAKGLGVGATWQPPLPQT